MMAINLSASNFVEGEFDQSLGHELGAVILHRAVPSHRTDRQGCLQTYPRPVVCRPYSVRIAA
jgi:hypothetical protein